MSLTSAADALSALQESLAAMHEALAPAADLDWSRPAGDLDWTCRYTLEHTADDLGSYAGQVVGRTVPLRAYLGFELAFPPDLPIERLLGCTSALGIVLGSVVQTEPAEARGWHPYGSCDPAGFAMMGVVEILMHTDDIVTGLGRSWSIPARPAALALERLFPDSPNGEPATVLRWSTGRQALPDRPRRTQWAWDSSVPGDR